MVSTAVTPEPVITTAEYQGRVERIREAMSANHYDALILYGDSIRISNIKYVVDFWPLDALADLYMAVVILPLEGTLTLYVSEMNLLWGEEVSWFPARPFRDLPAGLFDLRNKLGQGKVGVTGLSFMPVGLYDVIRGVFGMSQIDVSPAQYLLAKLKAKKSPAEIAMHRKAGEYTIIGLDAIKAAVCSEGLKTEREIAAMATSKMWQDGGDGPAFDIQIQSGIHSSYNNIRSTEKIVKPGDSILIEMGANYRGYLTDIARGATFGDVDPRQIDIIKAAAEAQAIGREACKPGITAHELNAVIQKALTDAGYIEYSDEAKGHGTGHGIGTDIEEDEPWIRPGNTFVLEEGVVMALKASIFVPGLAGVRVEDNVLVTPNGAENLTPYTYDLTW